MISRLLQRRLKLPPPSTRDLVVQRDLRVPMPDGVELLADRWAPRAGGSGLPTALIRCPYGRRGVLALGMARPLAERGFQVLIQSTRGGFGSGGAFDPLRQEREDGLATLDWLTKQPWFGDSIVLVGVSYMGSHSASTTFGNNLWNASACRIPASPVTLRAWLPRCSARCR
ncbi:CocE/NonD family hydrolase [Nonomuraea turkmeniaca]|uniref:CocE/NonD family hydrolase n=1 Tax=Nonomuraea turkmeniaca TaxID=103838 RepID=UPI001B86F019|nr:CocE/NonD family hydrolase [Nonomuraea turkmeniaca]